jgi:hypothetical protein
MRGLAFVPLENGKTLGRLLDTGEVPNGHGGENGAAGVETKATLKASQSKSSPPDAALADAFGAATGHLGEACAEDRILGKKATKAFAGKINICGEFAREAARPAIHFGLAEAKTACGFAVGSPKAQARVRAEHRKVLPAKAITNELEEMIAAAPAKVEIDVREPNTPIPLETSRVEEALETKSVA